jgi:phenylalanyl-tRNA synthetase beta chain
VAKFNLDRRADRVCIFEVGRVFHHDASVQDSDTTVKGFHQPMRLGGLAVGPVHGLTWEGGKTNFDFYDVKGHVEQLLSPAAVEFSVGIHPAFHPGRSAVVMLDGQEVGHLGELHPKWCQSWGFPIAPVMFELDLACLINRQVPAFEAFSKIQSVERDISVWVNEAVTHAELMACIHATPIQPVLRDAHLFDVYRPSVRPADTSPEKSLAIRLVLKRDDAVLTEQEIDAAVAAVVDRLGQVLSARLRA